MSALLLKLKFPSEAAWLAAQAATLADAKGKPLPGVHEPVLLGVFLHETGNMITVTGPGGQPMQVPERVLPANPGYHVDIIVPASLNVTALHSVMVNPATPRHVYAGNLVVAMPETLPEAEETAMVTRGIGQAVPDDQLARIELALLRGRLTPEMAADRRAWIEAGIAITESRAALSTARQDRERAVEDARRADAERDRIDAERAAVIAQRDAEEAKRAAAVVAAQSATGKARTDAIAARDAALSARNAATAAASALLAERDAEVAKLAAAVAARDAAVAVLEAERVRIAAARVARDALKAAIK